MVKAAPVELRRLGGGQHGPVQHGLEHNDLTCRRFGVRFTWCDTGGGVVGVVVTVLRLVESLVEPAGLTIVGVALIEPAGSVIVDVVHRLVVRPFTV